MDAFKQYDPEAMRLRLFAVLITVLLSTLLMTLWRIQVVHAAGYRTSLDRQSMRRVRLPAPRGRILDRNGTVVADNRPSYCIAIYTEELRRPGRWANTVDAVDNLVDRLALLIEQPRQITREDIAQHVRRRLPLPLLAWRDVGPETMGRWAEQGATMAGVDIYAEPVRIYPVGELLSHIVGYVRRADPASDDAQPYHYYLPDMEGADGIERALNTTLAGAPGGKLIRVDASGFRYEEHGEREPRPGSPVRLTLDIRIQTIVAEWLGERPAAAVVLDPRNGDVLALVSSPRYDTRALSSREAWTRILANPDRPLLNRAIAGTYPPGSTFKPIVAITGLESGTITPTGRITCTGVFHHGRDFHCWLRRGHGPLTTRQAIEQSCNPFFTDLGVQTGYQRIFHMADAFGFGHRTGIELPGEQAGLLPDDAWKRRVMGEGWRGGDTCNVSLGQGALLVTPLQMAMFAAALGNGGHVYRPRLVAHRPEGDLLNRMAWSPATLEAVRGGMHDAVQLESGTGKRAWIEGITMGGKTGTAQYGRDQKHAWMILFAPFESPRYAVAMVVEDAVSGGISAAPRIREIMRRLLVLDGALPASSLESGVL